MSDTAIKVEHLSKKYVISHQVNRKGQDTLRDSLANGVKSLGKKLIGKSLPSSDKENFWALNDLSFDINEGDRVGVIGRNGAGKSTLLKVLSRIVEPTQGKITIVGRVSSLLEVGTGFHAELSGRENIFLNGAILGMSKVEIKRKFDEIVDFSGVEKFLDTPVKRYSSGMYVRLAFSVAAHLEPEILIVDEVLAVGDMEFQKKCLAKMEDVAKNGRTVLFVSHNMASIQGLCNKGIMLNAGQLRATGDIGEVINQYINHTKALVESHAIAERNDRKGNGTVRVTNIRFKDMSTHCWTNETISGRDVLVEITYQSLNSSEPIRSFNIGLTFHSNDGQFISVVNSRMANNAFEEVPANGQVYCLIPRLPLMSGNYFVTFNLNIGGLMADHVTEATSIQVEPGDFFGTGIDNAYGRQGVYFEQIWKQNDEF